jgi:hypothetical protein
MALVVQDSEIVSEHSYARAMEAAARLFSMSETKWPDFYLPLAKNLLVDELLTVALHLRRISEVSSGKMVAKIQNMSLNVPRDFTHFETDLWTAINRIVHHHSLNPQVITDYSFYRSDNEPMAGHLIADISVMSDRGESRINIAGFAIAVTNELGRLSRTPKKVFH